VPLNLDPFKPANGEKPISSAKMRNAFDAIVTHSNEMPISDLEGYPADGSLYANGAGGWSAPPTGPFVTALPSFPVDEQVCVFRADDANDVFWQLKYRLSTAHWLKIGGPPLFAIVNTAEAVSSATFADLATVGPSITMPLSGVGYVDFGANLVQGTPTGGGSTETLGVYLGTAPVTNDQITSGTSGGGSRCWRWIGPNAHQRDDDAGTLSHHHW